MTLLHTLVVGREIVRIPATTAVHKLSTHASRALVIPSGNRGQAAKLARFGREVTQLVFKIKRKSTGFLQ